MSFWDLSDDQKNSLERTIEVSFTDIFVDVIQLLSDGYVDVSLTAFKNTNDKKDVSAVYQYVELEIELGEFALNAAQWLYKNIFFTLGIVLIFVFIFAGVGYFIAKRIVYRKAKQLAKDLY